MTTSIAKILLTKRNEILQEWLQQQLSALDLRADLISEAELRTDSSRFLNVLSDAIQSGNLSDIQAPEYKPVLEMLSDFSRARGLQGFTPSESGDFRLLIKQPLFTALRLSGGRFCRPGRKHVGCRWPPRPAWPLYYGGLSTIPGTIDPPSAGGNAGAVYARGPTMGRNRRFAAHRHAWTARGPAW